MGLFSTLKTSSEGPTMSGSAVIPTVVQLYTEEPVQLDTATARVNAYTALTYQAVQVGSANEELKNKHQNPDLGVWNCAVKKTKDAVPLADHILNNVLDGTDTFLFTVRLDGGEQALARVEPAISAMQETLIRHFIEMPPSSVPVEDPKLETDADDSGADGDTRIQRQHRQRETATTTLFHLKSTQFGLAPEDDNRTLASQETESDRDVRFALMINAVLPARTDTEASYRTKQAKELVIYHLRRFAFALNANLCFVQPPSVDESPTVPSDEQNVKTQQPAVSYEEIGKLWKDLATDKPICSDSEEEKDEPTALYGPGKHQEDLIESVLLRSAHCPGHWEANKDSLWVALPTPQPQNDDGPATPSGDQGWLTQLRDSIASAVETAPAKAAATEEKTDEPEKNDAALSSFFQGLLNNP